MFNFIYQKRIKYKFESNEINSNIDLIVKELLKKNHLSILNNLSYCSNTAVYKLKSENSIGLKIIKSELKSTYDGETNMNFMSNARPVIFGFALAGSNLLGNILIAKSNLGLPYALTLVGISLFLAFGAEFINKKSNKELSCYIYTLELLDLLILEKEKLEKLTPS